MVEGRKKALKNVIVKLEWRKRRRVIRVGIPASCVFFFASSGVDPGVCGVGPSHPDPGSFKQVGW